MMVSDYPHAIQSFNMNESLGQESKEVRSKMTEERITSKPKLEDIDEERKQISYDSSVSGTFSDSSERSGQP